MNILFIIFSSLMIVTNSQYTKQEINNCHIEIEYVTITNAKTGEGTTEEGYYIHYKDEELQNNDKYVTVLVYKNIDSDTVILRKDFKIGRVNYEK